MQINIGKRATVALIAGTYAGRQVAVRPRWWTCRFRAAYSGGPGLKTYNFSVFGLWVCVSREVFW